MRTEFGGSGPAESAFSRALADLKRTGSNILVVGADGTDPHRAVCRRLLGAESSRRRLVVRTAGEGICGWQPPDDVDGHSRVIVHGQGGRSVARSATTVDSRLLGPLATAVGTAIDEAERDGGGVEAGELRLCFDSLGPLFSSRDPETVFRLVHVLTARVRNVKGMGHFHLRVDRNDDHVKLLEPLFDAVVRVRTSEGGHEHQWHVLDQDVESEWIEV